jgi:hypothetical protein
MVTFYTILRVFIEKAKLLRHLEVSSSVPQKSWSRGGSSRTGHPAIENFEIQNPRVK